MNMSWDQRLIVSCSAFTIVVFFISFWMKQNGVASPSNPAWAFVVGVRWISLVLSISVFTGFILQGVFSILNNPTPSPQRQISNHAPPPPSPEEIEARRLEKERRRKDSEERRKVEAAQREQKRQEEEKARKEKELELIRIKQTRTFAAAVDAAMKEF